MSELDRDPVLSPKQSECTSFEVPSQRRERQRPGKLGRLKCKGEGMGRKVEHELQNWIIQVRALILGRYVTLSNLLSIFMPQLLCGMETP